MHLEKNDRYIYGEPFAKLQYHFYRIGNLIFGYSNLWLPDITRCGFDGQA